MAIYRGPGGPGDATADAASEAALISALVTQAQTAETNAGNSASAAGVSATSASNSATAAAASASNASTSATNAANSATTAATSASNAGVLANVAANEATAAATSASNAAASYDSFDDRYLGAKSSAPTLDNDGDALLTGALYWNTVGNQLYLWDGSSWVKAALNVSNAISSTTTISSPLSWNSDNYTLYAATAQAGNLTINADSGTPLDGQKIIFRFTCDGTARTITFTGGSSKSFKPVGITLTTSGSNFTYVLSANKTTYFGAVYNTSSSRWEVVVLSQEV